MFREMLIGLPATSLLVAVLNEGAPEPIERRRCRCNRRPSIILQRRNIQ
jgi:hypothetical protein